MTKLNKKQCYKILDNKLDAEGAKLNLKKFNAFLERAVGKSASSLAKAFKKHIGNLSAYTNKKGLEESLVLIQRYLERHKSETQAASEIQTIAKALVDGIGNCSQGYHDRVNAILIGIARPQNIDDLLERLRIGIIDSAARNCSAEVHTHNQFFMVANKAGYGVQAINAKDEYAGLYNPDDISVLLAKEFKKRYTPLSILMGIQLEIESELRNYCGYQGYQPKGYKYAEYEKMWTFLNNIFGEELDCESIFKLNENQIPTDIHWPVIQEKLVEKLHQQQYIIFSQEEYKLLQILSINSALFPEYIEDVGNKEVFQTLMLYDYPALFKHCSSDVKNQISDALFSQSVFSMPLQALRQYLQNYAEFHVDNVEKKQAFSDKCLAIWLSNEENITSLPEIFNSADMSLLELGFEMLDKINDDTFKNIILNTQSAIRILHRAIKHRPAALSKVCDLIVKMSSQEKNEVLSAIHNRYSSFSLAINSNPEALPALFELLDDVSILDMQQMFIQRYGHNYTLLMCAVFKKNVRSLDEFTGFLQKHMDIAMHALSQTTFNDGNVLHIAAGNSTKHVNCVLNVMRLLPTDDFLSLMCAQEIKGCTPLMRAARYNPESAFIMLNALGELPKRDLCRVLLIKDGNCGMNFFSILEKHHPDYAKKCFDQLSYTIQRMILLNVPSTLKLRHKKAMKEVIESLSDESPIEKTIKNALQSMHEDAHYKCVIIDAIQQLKQNGAYPNEWSELPKRALCEVLLVKDRNGNNIFSKLEEHHLDYAEKCFDQLSFNVQRMMLPKVSNTLKLRHQKALKEVIESLSDASPIEKTIKKALLSMRVEAHYKQCAVIDALQQLKKNGAYHNESIVDALNNSERRVFI